MKRSVIRLAGKTHVVSLPSKWVKQFNIKKGEELDIEERGNKLVISTEKDLKRDSITIDTDKIGLFNKNYISFAYQKGYDEVELRYDGQDVFNLIRERVNDLMGYEIVDHGKDHCRIKNVSQLLDSEFDIMLRRSFLVTLDMAETCVDFIAKKQHDKLKELAYLEKTNNKFTDFCKRLINKKGYHEIDKSALIYAILRDIEEVADQYKYICKHGYETKVNLSKETIALFEEVNSYFRTLYELFYKFDKNKASKIVFKKKDLMNKLQELFFKTKNNDEKLIIHHLMCLTEAVFNMYGPCFVMNL
ncbi:MAG: AbrB/MazE/SpoVT family DNA-binding domain-containing protein [Nanoarchaeota archaeon]|nr:AbrB/MazE/SpoVT family DNA-binding domain-containing protein [Nanoarchaeota archaeon]